MTQPSQTPAPPTPSPSTPAPRGLGGLAIRLLTDPAVVARLGQGQRTNVIGWLMVANGASKLLGIDLGLEGLEGLSGEPTFANPAGAGGVDPLTSILTGLGLITLRSSVGRANGNG